MINIKKCRLILSFICIIAAVLLVTVACGKNPEPKPTEAPTTNCEHTNTKWVVSTSATCTAEGEVQKKCTTCEAVVDSAKIAKIAHTEELVAGKAATCTEAGVTAGKKCSVCSAEIVKQTEIPALQHKESDWIIDSEATATAVGKKHTQCVYCRTKINSADIPTTAADHTHKGKEWVTVKYASCVENGQIAFICECGKTVETASLAKTAHTEENVLGLSPTCTEAGKTDGKKCSVCKNTTVEQTALEPKGHSFDSGSCKNCGIAENYGIWIVDGLGKPMNDIFVKVLKNGEQVKLYPYNGEFLAMDLDTDTYQLELDLSQLEEKYIFDESLCTLTPDKRTASIRLLKTVGESQSIFVGAPISKDYTAYHVSDGSYTVELTPNDYTFFIFSPKTSAVYTVTYECDSKLDISYHGSTFFVQGADLTEGSENIFTYENGLAVSVYSDNIGGNYVFGVKSAGAESCILNIRNAGDPSTRLVDEPWTPYLEDDAKVQQHLKVSQDGTYTPIDLTDLTLSAVFNEADGFYHLNSADGPIIFIDLTSDCDYISSLQTICTNQRVGVYIYDINGNIVEKRSYNELFYQYGMPSDSSSNMPGSSASTSNKTIRVPLTAKLAEAIKNFGEMSNWWADGSEQNLFTTALMGAPYNSQYAWLLFCGYYS